jgi:hypothetical protein
MRGPRWTPVLWVPAILRILEDPLVRKQVILGMKPEAIQVPLTIFAS